MKNIIGNPATTPTIVNCSNCGKELQAHYHCNNCNISKGADGVSRQAETLVIKAVPQAVPNGGQYYLIQYSSDHETDGLGNYKRYQETKFVEADSFDLATEKIRNLNEHKYDKNFEFIDLTVK